MTGGLGDDIGGALFAAGKTFHAERKRRERDARREGRRQSAYTGAVSGPSLKSAVWLVMPDAVAAATGDGGYEVSARTLYYQVRPRIQYHTDKELDYRYFSQDLLVEYQNQYGPIAGLYREPRGSLYEPHTGRSLPLGTREVAEYCFPDYVFDKILYVEKAGLDPIWQAARLAQRFDLAIASGNGQPVEAIRSLFERADCGDYRLFVLHDADPAGYSIARTISEETNRMPGYCVEVIDLGLSVADAVALNLPTESFTRRKALPRWMPPRLSETELSWFEGRPTYRGQWLCTRVELNALTAPELVAYVEDGLTTNGAAEKILPPDTVIGGEAATALRTALLACVEVRLAEMLDLDAIVSTLTRDISAAVIVEPTGWVRDAYQSDRATYWRDAIADAVAIKVAGIEARLRARITDLILERTPDGDEER